MGVALEEKYVAVRKVIVGENDLGTWCKEHGEKGEELIKEWITEKNGDMCNYKPGSGKRVYWRCSICGEEYIKTISDRVRGTRHAPCGRKLGIEHLKQYHKNHMPFERSLLGARPDMIEEWDYEANKDIDPRYISVHSGKKVHWICKKCGCKYMKSIRNRTERGYGCKECRRRDTDKKQARRIKSSR